VALEPILAALVTLIGIGLTTYAEISHVSVAIAPGALLGFVGGAWLGNALARRGPRSLPTPREAKEP
jgi:hypothetical protein